VLWRMASSRANRPNARTAPQRLRTGFDFDARPAHAHGGRGHHSNSRCARYLRRWGGQVFLTIGEICDLTACLARLAPGTAVEMRHLDG
jgi:hypothetical protein